jgi:hypothetical protein
MDSGIPDGSKYQSKHAEDRKVEFGPEGQLHASPGQRRGGISKVEHA